MLTCVTILCQIRKIHQFLELINYSINWSPLFDFQPLKCYFLVEEKTKAILVLVFPKTDSKIIISFLIERKQDYFLFESPLNCIIVPHVKKSLNPVHTFGLTQRIWLRVSGSNNMSLSLSIKSLGQTWNAQKQNKNLLKEWKLLLFHGQVWTVPCWLVKLAIALARSDSVLRLETKRSACFDTFQTHAVKCQYWPTFLCWHAWWEMAVLIYQLIRK